MAVSRATHFTPAVRFFGSCYKQRLLTPHLSVGWRAISGGEYRRPGQTQDNTPIWKKFDFNKGVEGIRKHFTLLKNEFLGRWTGPEGKPLIEHILEQTRVIWEFRGPESLEQWTVSSDQEIGGRSEAYLKLGRNNATCLMYGTLCSAPPRDGETRYSGYCTLRSKPPMVSTDVVLT